MARFVCLWTPKPRHAGAYWQKLEGLKPPGYRARRMPNRVSGYIYQFRKTLFNSCYSAMSCVCSLSRLCVFPFLSLKHYTTLSLWFSPTAGASQSLHRQSLIDCKRQRRRSWQAMRSPSIWLCLVLCLSNRLALLCWEMAQITRGAWLSVVDWNNHHSVPCRRIEICVIWYHVKLATTEREEHSYYLCMSVFVFAWGRKCCFTNNTDYHVTSIRRRI